MNTATIEQAHEQTVSVEECEVALNEMRAAIEKVRHPRSLTAYAAGISHFLPLPPPIDAKASDKERQRWQAELQAIGRTEMSLRNTAETASGRVPELLEWLLDLSQQQKRLNMMGEAGALSPQDTDTLQREMCGFMGACESWVQRLSY